MKTIRWLCRAGLLGLLLIGCGTRSQPPVIHDTTGAAFDFYCDNTHCPITARPGSPPPTSCGGNEIYAFAYYRFIQICAATGSDTPGIYWSTSSDRCRLVACATNDECPQFDEYTYECRNSLCQAVQLTGPAVQWAEAELLCLGKNPRPLSCYEPTSFMQRQQVSQLLSQSCPDSKQPCIPPVSCLQP